MNLFEPRTFSTDWEIMVLDKLQRTVGEEKLMAFASLLSHELKLPVTVDWNTLECAMGINTSFTQLGERLETVTRRAAQLLGEWDLTLYRTGAHPLERMFNANHIHIGTLRDESAAITLETALLPYTAAFAALAANSALSSGRRGQWKSYRVAHNANGCAIPVAPRAPHFSQSVFGFDGGTKMQGAPTLEMRIGDAATSHRFLAEFATFVAAFVHHLGTTLLPKGRPPALPLSKVKGEWEISPGDYKNALVNRWSAAKHGLQAGFHTRDGQIAVTELISQMLDECQTSLETLGTRREDFKLIEAMLQKRVTQADWTNEIAGRYPDAWVFVSAHSKVARDGVVFEEWLQSAPTLETVSAPDDEEILQIHLKAIGEGTHFYRSREVMHLPPPMADEIIEKLIAQGQLRRDESAKRGVTLSRTQP